MKAPISFGSLEVSRHVAAQITICDEMGCNEDVRATEVVKRVQPHGFTEKEIRMALYRLASKKPGQLERIRPGVFRWVPFEDQQQAPPQ